MEKLGIVELYGNSINPNVRITEGFENSKRLVSDRIASDPTASKMPTNERLKAAIMNFTRLDDSPEMEEMTRIVFKLYQHKKRKSRKT